jgi:hypothetical protein
MRFTRQLPKNCLLRGDTPNRTPVVRGRIQRPAKLLGDDELTLTKELSRAENQEQIHARMVHASCAYFAAEYLSGPGQAPYYGRFLIGKHHLAWDKILAESKKACILASRDHGKSYFWSLAFPIWQGGWKEPGSLGYIFSASQELAEDFLQKIKDEILSNPRLKHLIPGSNDRTWSKREIHLSDGTVIRARGWGVRVRGGHPHWIICDDVLDDTSLYSETKRSRAVDYFFSVPVNMVVPGGILIVVGTPFHHADLYSKIKATNKYAYSVFAARNKEGEALFPDRYDEAALKDKEEEIGAARFAREFMCIPLTDEASLFPSKLFEGDVRLPYKLGLPGSYWEERGMPRYAGVDVAFSAETKADWFVIFIIALDSKGVRWIVDIIRRHGIGFQVMKDLIKDVNTKYGCDSINIEANQAQRFLPDAMIQEEGLSNVRRYFTSGVQPKKDWKKGMTTLTVGKHSIDRGVPAMRMSLENRQWRIPRGDEHSIEMTDIWIGEMGCITYQNGKVLSVGEHDDTAMACWMADTACRMGGASFAFAGMSDTGSIDERPKSLQAIPNLRAEYEGLTEESVSELDRIEEIKKKGGQEAFDPFGLGDL